MKMNPIQIAEEEVSIEDVLSQEFGINFPSGAGSWRVHCPLGDEHSDGGRSKAMRVYSESNTCYCFSHSIMWNPVTLMQLKTGESRTTTAKILLDSRGIRYKPLSPKEILDRRKRLNSEPPPTLDTSKVREAFFLRLGTYGWYKENQYQDDVVDVVNSLLASLDDVEPGGLESWMEDSKKVLEEFGGRYEH